MIVRDCGLLCCSLHVTGRVDNLLAFVDPAVLASRVWQERRLAGGAQADVHWLHGVMRPASANARS